tara:strand:+ start:107 stop:427 length:321 start_codon:yes stop_codon:yes gene_type:complete
MSEHDFSAWLKSQKGEDFVQIRTNGLDITADAELIVAGYREEKPGVSKEQSADFIKRVKQFLVFIEWHGRPDNVLEEDWKEYLPICRDLVEKGQMKSEVLELFSEK